MEQLLPGTQLNQVFHDKRHRNDFSVKETTIIEIGQSNLFKRSWFHRLRWTSHFRNKVVKLITEQNIEHFPGGERMKKVATKYRQIQKFCLKKLEKENDRIIAKNLPKDLRNDTFYKKVKKFEDRYEVICHLRTKDSWMRNIPGEEAISRLFPKRKKTNALLSALWEENDKTKQLDHLVALFHAHRDAVKLSAERKFEREFLHGESKDLTTAEIQAKLTAARNEANISKTERTPKLSPILQKWFETYVNIHEELNQGGAKPDRLLAFISYIESYGITNSENNTQKENAPLIEAYFVQEMTEEEQAAFNGLGAPKKSDFKHLLNYTMTINFNRFNNHKIIRNELVNFPISVDLTNYLVFSNDVATRLNEMGYENGEEIVALAIRRQRHGNPPLEFNDNTNLDQLKATLTEYAYDELMKQIIFKAMGEGFATTRKEVKLQALYLIRGLQERTKNKAAFMDIAKEDLPKIKKILETTLKSLAEEIEKGNSYDPSKLDKLTVQRANLLDLAELLPIKIIADIEATIHKIFTDNDIQEDFKWLDVIKKAIQRPLEFVRQVGTDIANSTDNKLGTQVDAILELWPQTYGMDGNLEEKVNGALEQANTKARQALGMDLPGLVDKGAALLRRFFSPFQGRKIGNPIGAIQKQLFKISPSAKEMHAAIKRMNQPITGTVDLKKFRQPVAEKIPAAFGPIIDELLNLDPHEKPETLFLKVVEILQKQIDNGVKIENLPEIEGISPVITAVIQMFSTQVLAAREEVKIARKMAALDRFENLGKKEKDRCNTDQLKAEKLIELEKKVKKSEIEKFLSKGTLSFAAFKELGILAGPLGKILGKFNGIINGVAGKVFKNKTGNPGWLQIKVKNLIGTVLKTELPNALEPIFAKLGLLEYAPVKTKFDKIKGELAQENAKFTWQQLFSFAADINKMGSFFHVPELVALDLYMATDNVNATNAERLAAARAKVKEHLQRVAIQLCDGSSEAQIRFNALKDKGEFNIAEAREIEKFAIALGIAPLPNDFERKSAQIKNAKVKEIIAHINLKIVERTEAITAMSSDQNEVKKKALKDAIVGAVITVVVEKILPNIELLPAELELVIGLHKFVANKNDQDSDLKGLLLPLLATIGTLADKYIVGNVVPDPKAGQVSRIGRVVTNGIGQGLTKLLPAIKRFMENAAE